MTRRTSDLSALPWQFGPVQRQPLAGRPADDRAAVTEWLPARVPGDVRADLIAAGRIPPLDTPEGIAAGAWVDDLDWWYRTTLPGGLAADEVAILEADGIDFYSAIWIDGQLLGAHAGMFSRRTAVLTPALLGPGPHELAIRIWGAGALPRGSNPPWRRAVRWLLGRVSPGTEYFPDRMLTPKAQFSFGWDFAPRVLSTGIWDEIRLVTVRGAYIEDLWVEAEPAGDEAPGGGAAGRVARVRVRANLRRWREGPLRAEVTVEPEGFDAPSARETFDLDLGSNFDLNLDLPAARLWWPWDQGESRLYRATVRLLDAEGVADEANRVVGARSVRREPRRDGNGWRFVVNGRPVTLRGANWVPADVLPGRVTGADYRRLLAQARAAGVNFLRVWGGGVREKAAFWETCDRLGIMAWQEFPLACAFLDHYPRGAAPDSAGDYLALLVAEVRGTIRALRNHPSLIAWCGGNEINPGRERQPLAAIRAVLAEEDPGRPWLPASPAPGDVHRWDVWHGLAPWTALEDETAGLVSEFGLQALPDPATVAEMFPDRAPADLADPRWPGRKAQIAKLLRYAGSDAAGPLDRAIDATQRAQAAGIQAGIEACRLRRANVAFWQFNEPWPAVTWAVVDRAGRPKAAYAALRRCFQPVLIAARFPWRQYAAGDAFASEVWLVNDGPAARAGCRAEAALDGAIVWARDAIDLPAAGATRIGEFAVELGAAPKMLTLQLSCAGETVAINAYDLAVHLPGRQPLRERILRWVADRLL